MKKFLAVALLVSMAWVGFAQAVDVSKLDLSDAKFSIAGPDAVYVRNLYYGGTRLSVLLKYNGQTGATVYGPYLDSGKLILDSYVVENATARIEGTNKLIISNLNLGGMGVAGRFSYDGVYTLVLDNYWRVPAPKSDDQVIAELKEQVGAQQKRYAEQVTATQRKAQADVAEAQEEAAEAKAALEAAQARVATLERQVAMERAKARSAQSTGGAPTGPSIDVSMIDVDDIDVSKAIVTIAGPDSVYVRNLYYAGTRFSVDLEYDGAGGAIIYGPYMNDDKLLMDSYEMGEAKLRIEGTDTLVVSDLIIAGAGFAGRLKYDGVYSLKLTNYWQTATPKTDDMRIAELRKEVEVAQAEAAGAKADAAAAEAAAETAQAALEEAKADLADAKADLNAAQRRITTLQRQVADARSQATAAAAGSGMMLAPATSRSVDPSLIDPEDVDVSKAIVSLAGPDSIYVRNLYYAGERFSVTLKYNGSNGALIYGPYFNEDKLLLDSYNMGEAKLRLQGNDTLLVSDLILGGNGYAGRLKYDGVYTLALASYWETMAPKTDEMRVAELENKVESQDEMIASLQDRLRDAEEAAASAVAAVPADMPTRIAKSGFSGGRSLYGNWSVSSTSARQTDTSLFFAKYEIPVSQTADQTLYTLKGAGNQTARVGYGLHFYASGNNTGAGYGFGSSYLVWLTRDPGYYGTNDTYVQLYQSFDDVRMVQLASVAVPASISRSMTTDVLYDKDTKTVTVMVNGDVAFAYQVSAPIARGSKVALRTMGGPVQFTGLTIKTK